MQDIGRTICCATVIALLTSSVAADELNANLRTEPAGNPSEYDLSGLIRPPGADSSDEQRENFASFTEALANLSWSEAEVSAKQMVEIANADKNSSTQDAAFARAAALQNLAVAQQFRGKHESAKQNYVAAIDVIVGADNNLSPELILPLRGLAIAHLDMEEVREAFEFYDRAMHVSSVNFGPHSLQQLPILDEKLQIYLSREDSTSALDVLDRVTMLYTRKYPKYSEERLPAYYLQADIYGKLGLSAAERSAWRSILAIKQEHYARNDPALIEPNRKIAENLMRAMLKDEFRSVTTSAAERHLKAALWIADNSAEQDWKVRTDCLLSLADFYTLFDMKGRARRYYAEAWDLMSSNESYLGARSDELEAPVPLALPAPERYANFEYNPNRDDLDPDDYLEGEMVMSFDVNERGRTEKLRLVRADPENFPEMELRLRNAVKEFVYRPRLTDGKVAATGGLEYRFRYFYTPTEHQASLDKASKPRSPWQSRKQ
jgi:hypothetical protein